MDATQNVKAYTTLEALQVTEKPGRDAIIKKALASATFKTNADVTAYVNQNNIVELVDIHFDPTLKNQIGAYPWILFHWFYYIREGLGNE
jgi:hypothetical protein